MRIDPKWDFEPELVIDKRIDTSESESMRDRWEFGMVMLTHEVPKGDSKQLKYRYLNALSKATGKSRSELQQRAAFARAYPTEEKMHSALCIFPSWLAWTKRGQSKPDKPQDRSSSAPKQHDRHDEVVELHGQGLSQRQIAEKTGIGARSVRAILEREQVEQNAKNAATLIDWASMPGTIQEKLGAIRRQVIKEVEAEIEPRVQARVEAQLELARNSMRVMQEKAAKVLKGNRGIFTPSEWKEILFVAHPDTGKSVSDEQRANVFRLLREADILLIKEST
jgi:lambda repressor-like predicted transcriptional regulator